MAARFEVKIAKNGEYMFNLIAPNGQVIATSETYTAKHNCLGGIESVRTNARVHVEDQIAGGEALLCPKYELFLDKEEKPRFRLVAANGEIICASQGYTTKSAALGGIASIGENAPVAEIVFLEG